VPCVPEATANLITVSAAVRDRCSFVTRDNGVFEAMVGGTDWKGRIVEEKGHALRA
jgi:hypothetical protein